MGGKNSVAYKVNYARLTYARLQEYLTLHPCVDCGEPDPVVLDFDHVRGVKTNGVARMAAAGYSWKRILEEIAKCEVRCRNCHHRVTMARIPSGGRYSLR